MKKYLSYLLAPVVLIAFVALVTVSQEAEKKNDIQGAWQLEKSKYEENASLADATQVNYKIFSGNKFFVIAINDKDVERTHGGSYELDGGKLTEKVEFASEALKDAVDQTFTFDVEVKDGQLIQKSAEGSALPNLEEHWKHVE